MVWRKIFKIQLKLFTENSMNKTWKIAVALFLTFNQFYTYFPYTSFLWVAAFHPFKTNIMTLEPVDLNTIVNYNVLHNCIRKRQLFEWKWVFSCITLYSFSLIEAFHLLVSKTPWFYNSENERLNKHLLCLISVLDEWIPRKNYISWMQL